MWRYMKNYQDKNLASQNNKKRDIYVMCHLIALFLREFSSKRVIQNE